MRPPLRSAQPKRVPRGRLVGRLRLDVAAELLRLEFERARLSAQRGRLSSGLSRAENEYEATQARISRLIEVLGGDHEPGSRQ